MSVVEYTGACLGVVIVVLIFCILFVGGRRGGVPENAVTIANRCESRVGVVLEQRAGLQVGLTATVVCKCYYYCTRLCRSAVHYVAVVDDALGVSR